MKKAPKLPDAFNTNFFFFNFKKIRKIEKLEKDIFIQLIL